MARYLSGVHGYFTLHSVNESTIVEPRELGRSCWFGAYSTAESLNAGIDLEMPGPSRLRGPFGRHRNLQRPCILIEERVRNVLGFVQKASKIVESPEESTRELPEDRKLNRKLAADNVVLLKKIRDGCL